MEEVKEVKKRVRDELETESDIDSPEVKRLREDLLNSLDDDPEFCTSNQDLDSFMKSFEVEITASPSAGSGGGGGEAVGIELESMSDESRLELGYLLEASDDELGIPPPPAPTLGMENEFKIELVPVESDSSEFGGDFADVPSYDTFGFGLGEDNYNGEYVALDGLYDYSDLGFWSGDFSCRPETLPAQ